MAEDNWIKHSPCLQGFRTGEWYPSAAAALQICQSATFIPRLHQLIFSTVYEQAAQAEESHIPHARLQQLENNHPGISVIHRDVMGTILLDETDLGLDGLIKEMRAEADAE